MAPPPPAQTVFSGRCRRTPACPHCSTHRTPTITVHRPVPYTPYTDQYRTPTAVHSVHRQPYTRGTPDGVQSVPHLADRYSLCRFGTVWLNMPIIDPMTNQYRQSGPVVDPAPHLVVRCRSDTFWHKRWETLINPAGNRQTSRSRDTPYTVPTWYIID